MQRTRLILENPGIYLHDMRDKLYERDGVEVHISLSVKHSSSWTVPDRKYSMLPYNARLTPELVTPQDCDGFVQHYGYNVHSLATHVVEIARWTLQQQPVSGPLSEMNCYLYFCQAFRLSQLSQTLMM